MTARPDLINTDEIAGFVAFIHDCASQSTRHLADPGRIQLTAVHPHKWHSIYPRFSLGDVGGMTKSAISCAELGYNVWTQGRTIRSDLPKRQSPTTEDTAWVFALVVDYDGAGVAPFRNPESFAVQTSCHDSVLHAHLWYLTSLSPEQGSQIGKRMRLASGADNDTGVIAQDYRIPGTPNYPSPKKIAVGRVTEPTFGLSSRFSKATYTFGQLDALLPQLPTLPPSAPVVFDDTSGRTAIELLDRMPQYGNWLLQDPKGILKRNPKDGRPDRDYQFWCACCLAFDHGLTPVEVYRYVISWAANGCANKFLARGQEALRNDIKGNWERWSAKRSPA